MHNLEVPGQGLSRHIPSLVEPPTCPDAAGKTGKLTPKSLFGSFVNDGDAMHGC